MRKLEHDCKVVNLLGERSQVLLKLLIVRLRVLGLSRVHPQSVE